MSEAKLVSFEVRAADPGAELFLVDGDFTLIQRGIGRATFSVPSGVYKIRSRSGRTYADRIVVVREGMSPILLDPIPLVSGMPFAGAPKTHEFHISAAETATRQPPIAAGQGSGILIVARRWTRPDPAPDTPIPPHPGRGLTLRDVNGAVLVDLAAATTPDRDFDPSIVANVSVNPGGYLLAATLPDGRIVEQALFAASGWQTHVYLLLDAGADPGAGVDVINAAITYRRPVEPFNPTDQALRNEEMARRALEDSRGFLSAELRALLVQPGISPMLALLGAHLLLQEARRAESRQAPAPAPLEAARSLVRQIVATLRQTLGRHPDVEALAFAAGDSTATLQPFDLPPMLRASWDLLLEASLEWPQAIVPGSLAAQVGERIWGEGSWLFWLDPKGDTVDRAALWQARARELLAAFATRQAKPTTGGDAATFPGGVTFDAPVVLTAPPTSGVAGTVWKALSHAAESAVRRARLLVTTRARPPFPKLSAERATTPTAPGTTTFAVPAAPLEHRKAGVSLTDEQRKELVRRLGIPQSSVAAWLDQATQ